MTYADAVKIFNDSPKAHVWVPLVHRDGKHHDWLPIDKVKYLSLLKDCTNLSEVTYPWGIEIERDGDLFIHPKMEELLDNRIKD